MQQGKLTKANVEKQIAKSKKRKAKWKAKRKAKRKAKKSTHFLLVCNFRFFLVFSEFSVSAKRRAILYSYTGTRQRAVSVSFYRASDSFAVAPTSSARMPRCVKLSSRRLHNARRGMHASVGAPSTG